MFKYVFLLKAGLAGSLQLAELGPDLLKSQKARLEGVGGVTVRNAWTVSGAYDMVMEVDFADEATCLAAALAFTADGFHAETLRAFSDDELGRARDVIRALKSSGRTAADKPQGPR